MARRSSPWSALRPVLLAGAAAVTWLTLSSTAASADAGPDASSLLGSVTKPVSSLTQTIVDAIPPAPAVSTTDAATAPGLAQPVAAQVSSLADGLIASVPVVGQVVPVETVSTVTAPLAELADGLTAGVVDAVAAPAAGAVPVLEPVLQPVSDLLTGTDQLPLPRPDVPVTTVPAELPVAASPASADTSPAAPALDREAGPTATEAGQTALFGEATENVDTGLATRGNVPLAATAGARSVVVQASGAASEEPAGPADPTPLPGQAPAAPASGTGAGGSSSGSSGAAAWLSPFDFDFERPGTLAAGNPSEHAPAPVSFDPGSSPD
jgi:hypothetical protein